jgi:two-component system nitrate/nitrite sensor histidine kinase NarX
MLARQTLAFRLVATGIGFLVVALASIVLTLWVTWQLEGGAAAVNEAGRMRMMSYRLALNAVTGQRAALPAQIETMDTTIELLAVGDPSRPLFVPWSDEARAEFAAVRGQWKALRGDWVAGVRDVPAAQVDAMVGRVDRFVSMIEHRLSRWTEVLRGFQLTMVGLAIGSAVLLLYAMHLMVLDPLSRLGQGLGAIRSGDFGARVQVTSSDEFGELAAGFNAMAARLQSLYGDLEDKVKEKTARLEDKRERLAALYEVSAFVAQAENLDELARGFVTKIRRIARADAVAVRWSDDKNRHYVMLAQEGLPPALANAEQCVSAGSCHCGQRADTAATRTIPILAEGGPPDRACALAGFKSLLTVPVSLHHHVLGEVDLFYRDDDPLDEEHRSLIETLASHLAGGIEALRATAADRESAIAGERSMLAQELHDSIAQSLAFLKIQVDLLRGALHRADADAAARTVDEIDAGVRESYADVRELLLHFRTRTSTQDIEPALRSTLQKFEHQTGLPTSLSVEGHGVALPADVQVQVMHVVQEALSNVRKHARASSVRVQVQQAPEWRFEVADDGIGFDPEAVAGASHVGLHIMQERAERIGARVAVYSHIGCGTRVVLTLPSERSLPSTPARHDIADSLAGR